MDVGASDGMQVKSLSAAPDDLRPHGNTLGVLDRFWKLIVPSKVPADRPTVTNPAAAPHAAVALLNFLRKTTGKPQYLGSATGFYVEPDLVVTAAHNLYYSAADIIAVYPAWDDRLNQSQVVSALRWAKSDARDVGLILMPRRAGPTISLDGGASAQARLVGYAFPYPDRTDRMSEGTGPCHLDGFALKYALNAQQADSGGPVLGANDSAMAIHRERLPGPGGTMLGAGEHVDQQVSTILSQLEVQLRQH